MTTFDREAWLRQVIDKQDKLRSQGRTNDAAHLGTLAVNLEQAADGQGWCEASGRQLRRPALTSTAYRASLNSLIKADLVSPRGPGQFQLSIPTEATARVNTH